MTSIKSFDGGEFEGYLALPASGYGPGIVVLQEVEQEVGFAAAGTQMDVGDEDGPVVVGRRRRLHSPRSRWLPRSRLACGRAVELAESRNGTMTTG